MKRNAHSTVIPINDCFRLVVRRHNYENAWCIWQQIPHQFRGRWRNYTYHGAFATREAAEAEAEAMQEGMYPEPTYGNEMW